jgi:glycerophosphoryl diester phosphodiesterase
MTRPRVIAHRGSSAHHADNSWAAFEAAVAERADAIECDVQITRDGVIVVRHDLAIGDRLVADMNFAEVAARVPDTPVLEELLAFAARAPIDLLVEIKDADAADAVARMIDADGRHSHIVVGSFHGPALVAVKATAPRIRTSFMMGSVVAPDELIRLAAALRTEGVHLCWESRAPRPHRLVDRAAIEQLRRAGVAVTLWHEERVDELRALVAMLPDAICTNTPQVLRQIVDSQHARSGVEKGTASGGGMPLPPIAAGSTRQPAS